MVSPLYRATGKSAQAAEWSERFGLKDHIPIILYFGLTQHSNMTDGKRVCEHIPAESIIYLDFSRRRPNPIQQRRKLCLRFDQSSGRVLRKHLSVQ